MATLLQLKEILVTEQQEQALIDYVDQVLNFDRKISGEDFIGFYALWCHEYKKYKDLTSGQIVQLENII